MRRIPGRLVGQDRRQRRPHGVRADAAGARAAHPPRTRDLEHLHQSGALRADRDDLSRAHGQDRAARRARRSTSSASRELATRGHRASPASTCGSPRRSSTSSSCASPAGRRRARRAARTRHPRAASTSGRCYPELRDCILMTATELTTGADIERAGDRACARCRDVAATSDRTSRRRSSISVRTAARTATSTTAQAARRVLARGAVARRPAAARQQRARRRAPLHAALAADVRHRHRRSIRSARAR